MTNARFDFDFDRIFSTPANPRIERLMTDLEKIEDGSRSSAAADLSTVPDAVPVTRKTNTERNEDV
jgi:hypothetical protein